MKKALRGINLGGWLVAERWMTPDLFAGVAGDGESAIVRELGAQAAAERLEQHRSTFITEEDFRWIAKKGFDFIRLPVGYWLFEKTSNFIDGETYLAEAFSWARQHSLGVILDFHGLQGSQNGNDHSGQIGYVGFYRCWNRRAALRTLEYMARQYGHEPALIAIEVINEPKIPWWTHRLTDYYDRAYDIVAFHTSPEVKIIVSDGFAPDRLLPLLLRNGYRERLVLDMHMYQIFTQHDKQMRLRDHVDYTNNVWAEQLISISQAIPILIGEWTAALPTEIHRFAESDFRKHYSTQKTVFDRTVWAHAYWSYKAPGVNAPWDFRATNF